MSDPKPLTPEEVEDAREWYGTKMTGVAPLDMCRRLIATLDAERATRPDDRLREAALGWLGLPRWCSRHGALSCECPESMMHVIVRRDDIRASLAAAGKEPTP